MKCPNCGKPAGVIDTRLIEEGTVRMRRRKCHPERGGCGTKFNTIERHLDVVRGPLFAGVKSLAPRGPQQREQGTGNRERKSPDPSPQTPVPSLPAVSIGNYLGDPQARNWPERRILELQC